MYYKVIANLAQERNISIKALEKAAGLGNGTVGKWRTMKPNVGNLEKIAEVLGVDVADIIKASEESRE